MRQISVNRSMRTLLVAAACGALVSLGLAAPASAHAALTSVDPRDGQTLEEAPADVRATFSEILDGPSTEIAVTDPTGAALDLDDPVYDGDAFTQPMLYTVPGEYTLAFRVVSEDGHRVDDSVSFTVETIPDGLYVPGSEPTGEATSGAADATGEATSEAAETTAAAAEEDSNTGAALAAILLGLLVIVVGGVALVKFVGRGPATPKGS